MIKQLCHRIFWCVAVIGVMAFTCESDGLTENADASPSFSPDGETIAYIHRQYHDNGGSGYRTGIYSIDKNGGDRKLIFTDAGNEYPNYSDLTWSPDGEMLAFNDGQSGGLTICAPDGSGSRSFGSGVGNFSWSADSRYIIYADLGELKFISADFQQQGKLFDKTISGNSPEFSRDGKKLLYALPPEFQGQLVVIDSAGTELANLQTEYSDYFRSCHWSPDGTKVVYTAGKDYEGEVVVVNADGSSPVRIDKGVARSWSSKNEIAYVRNGRSALEGYIFVASPDGKHTRQVTFSE